MKVIRPYYIRFKQKVNCIKCNIQLQYFIRPKRGFIRCITNLIYVICPCCKKIYNYTKGNLHYMTILNATNILFKILKHK